MRPGSELGAQPDTKLSAQPGTKPGTRRLARIPWWLSTLLVYASSRILTLAMFACANAPRAKAGLHNTTFFDFLSTHDGVWYFRISQSGYPSVLPWANGKLQMNNWAFYPLYPYLTKLVSKLSGMRWQVAGPLLSMVAAGAAMLVIYRLVARVTPGSSSLPLGTVTLISFFPTSAILSTSYAEALTLLVLAAFLYLLVARRYEWAGLCVLALGLSRGVALPCVAVVLAHILVRWHNGRSHTDIDAGAAEGAGAGTGTGAGATNVSTLDFVRMGVLTLVSLIAAFLWPIIAAVTTGQLNAYFATERIWQPEGLSSLPFVPWVQMLNFPAAIVLTALVLGSLILLLAKPSRSLGLELRVFGLVYLLYLMGAEAPDASQLRFMLLSIPIFAALWAASKRHGWLRVLIILIFVLGEAAWIWTIWSWHVTFPFDISWEWSV